MSCKLKRSAPCNLCAVQKTHPGEDCTWRSHMDQFVHNVERISSQRQRANTARRSRHQGVARKDSRDGNSPDHPRRGLMRSDKLMAAQIGLDSGRRVQTGMPLLAARHNFASKAV